MMPERNRSGFVLALGLQRLRNMQFRLATVVPAPDEETSLHDEPRWKAERERVRSDLSKLTRCLTETQERLNEVLLREGELMDELGELRTLVDAQQDEIHVVTEARRHVQGICEELRLENERLRAALRDATPEREAEPQVPRPMDLVNVAGG
jgi:DNA repair ATPase RecN